MLTGLSAALLGLLIVSTASEETPAWSLMDMLAASFGVALPSVAIAVPLALLAALFAVAYCPPSARRAARDVIFVLSACPPVVWALASLFVVLPALERCGLALGVHSRAILVLCLVIAPPLTRTLVDDLRRLPSALAFAGRALGASTFAVHAKILLPAIAPQACRALCGALVRALGEGVALYVVLGSDADSHSLAAHLTLSLFEPDAELGRAGFAAAALILMVTSLALLAAVHALTASWMAARGRVGGEEMSL